MLSGINGEVDKNGNLHLFAPESANKVIHSVSVGDLVVRSPDWEYSDEDGGAGSVGIVQEVTAWESHGGKGLRVRWQENGFERVYRYGFNGRYDVQNVENTRFHNGPLIIRGSSFVYEFVPSKPQATTSFDLSAAIPEFGGSLELDGSVRLDLKLSEDSGSSLSKSDCSIEFWTCIAKNAFDTVDERTKHASFMEIFRISGAQGRIILLCDQFCKCKLLFQAVDASGKLVEPQPCHANVESDNGSSCNMEFGQWAHLALVFSGSKISVIKNGDTIYSCRCTGSDRLVLGSNSAVVFGDLCNANNASADSGDTDRDVSSLAFCGHLYDIRLWDVAFRVEQLRSHFRGLDSVDVVPKVSSRPGTPTSATGKPQSPSMTYLTSPRSPRASLRPVAVLQHLRKWVTTNRTSKDISTVRLNCSVKVSTSPNGDASSYTVYYEAHVLSSGKMCVGWILDGVDMQSRTTMIGEERDSFGIDIAKKQANLSTRASDLAPFTWDEPSGCSSPRRSIGANSFANDVFCRNGDVIGCALNVRTGKLTFYVNGGMVAECVAPSIDECAASLLSNSKDHEFDALVSEIVTDEKPSLSSASNDGATVDSTGTEAKLYPAASLSPQGAQGLAWNFGQRPFKFEPELENREVMSLLQASACTEEDAHFEVYDHDERRWDRVVYRHKVQDISPRLVGWWKLNEGMGVTVDDASGNGQQGSLIPSSSSDSATKNQVLPGVLAMEERMRVGTSYVPRQPSLVDEQEMVVRCRRFSRLG